MVYTRTTDVFSVAIFSKADRSGIKDNLNDLVNLFAPTARQRKVKCAEYWFNHGYHSSEQPAPIPGFYIYAALGDLEFQTIIQYEHNNSLKVLQHIYEPEASRWKEAATLEICYKKDKAILTYTTKEGSYTFAATPKRVMPIGQMDKLPEALEYLDTLNRLLQKFEEYLLVDWQQSNEVMAAIKKFSELSEKIRDNTKI